ncbi:hypothetical protein [Methylobacterium oxalidis]|nr:hypothetical protein [Methylobacterium oxalidis]
MIAEAQLLQAKPGKRNRESRCIKSATNPSGNQGAEPNHRIEDDPQSA